MIFEILQSLFSRQPIDVWNILAQTVSLLFVVIFILPLHEFAHGWAAGKLGDPTAKNSGRLTLNPIASLDKRGILCLLLFNFGWAKPVPVNPRYFRKPKRDMAIVALAGPMSNLLAALIGAFLYFFSLLFLPNRGAAVFILNVLWYYVLVNISLAAFNLIPIPPLDGSHILEAFLSDRMIYTLQRYRNVFSLILLVLMMSGALSGPLYQVQVFLSKLILNLAKWPFHLAGVL